MSLVSTRKSSIKMCRYFIIKDVDTRIFRKGALYCDLGLNGDICIDTAKVYSSPDPRALMTKTGTVMASTPTTTSLMMENLLQVTDVIIDTRVIGTHIDAFRRGKIECIQSMYEHLRMGKEMPPPSTFPSSVHNASSSQSASMNRSSQRRVRPASTVGPEDSISSVSRTPSQRYDMIENGNNDFVGGWVETSSVASIDSSKSHRTAKSSSTVRPPPAEPSVASSRASSRRMSSYTMARQVTIRE
jgi:hypothetical protein